MSINKLTIELAFKSDAGACGFLKKPFGVEDLAAEVQRALFASGSED